MLKENYVNEQDRLCYKNPTALRYRQQIFSLKIIKYIEIHSNFYSWTEGLYTNCFLWIFWDLYVFEELVVSGYGNTDLLESCLRLSLC